MSTKYVGISRIKKNADLRVINCQTANESNFQQPCSKVIPFFQMPQSIMGFGHRYISSIAFSAMFF